MIPIGRPSIQNIIIFHCRRAETKMDRRTRRRQTGAWFFRRPPGVQVRSLRCPSCSPNPGNVERTNLVPALRGVVFRSNRPTVGRLESFKHLTAPGCLERPRNPGMWPWPPVPPWPASSFTRHGSSDKAVGAPGAKSAAGGKGAAGKPLPSRWCFWN